MRYALCTLRYALFLPPTAYSSPRYAPCPMRYALCALRLPGSFPKKHHPDGFEHDLEVQKEGHILYVMPQLSENAQLGVNRYTLFVI